MSPVITALLTGYLVTISLIVAIGAQNAWVMGKSMRGEHPAVIAAVCITLDTLLIALGVFGLAQVQSLLPELVPVLTWLGVLLLLWLASQSLLRAWQGSGGLVASSGPSGASALQLAGQAALISLINPHVYLDTLVLIGSVGAQQADPFAFVVGAAAASASWFTLLTRGSRHLASWLKSPAHWRVFDLVMGLLLVVIALSLVL
ncbi:LysE/ArgO family amino acid transporter [Marinospirillum alkaliphilum]|uniref:L-lysine exporter family protein LysE/ArgO n=1 Tax=Marinospirillum alkaliphilum DSM 21637 TaxID=1122209 RepID=A0A1K1Y126_9GAMM|nr:LysE family transporter [Marinospirillum alkaliphilum]SFX55591.1 L-lysine exporter family protein LysE/ArgO [Marinospirillum alkaliphilum DSM 21637]